MNYTINTSIPISFDIIEELPDPRFTKVKIWLCHTGKNLNNSVFDKNVIEAAIPSLANIPILGFIEANNLNETDFKGHEQRLIIDKDGISIEYLGRAYGVVPQENNAQFEMKLCDDGIEREFLTVEALLWNKFSESTEIINRDTFKSQSMELEPSSIEGNFKKDGVFYFTKFMFEGACILGDNVTPAMTGSMVEKFNKQNYSAQVVEMLQEFNSYYSSALNPNKSVEPDNEGGKSVDEKLELFSKYPNLKDEDVAEIKENLEQYSLEELDTKLSEIVASYQAEYPEQPEDSDPEDAPNNFSLTAQQLEAEIRNALSKEKSTDQWGYEYRTYWYIDHDDNRVYAEDGMDGYRPVGLNYTLIGDTAVIDFGTKKKVKFVPQDMEDGVEVSMSFVSVERSEEIKEKTKAEVSEQFSEQLSKANEDLTKIKSENEGLAKFKEEKLEKEKLDVIQKFTSKLDEEELKPFVENLAQYSKEELELQLFRLTDGKQPEVQENDDKQTNLIFSLVGDGKGESNAPAWVEFVKQHKESKQK